MEPPPRNMAQAFEKINELTEVIQRDGVRLRRLKQWKDEAAEVLAAWDEVWVALGSPGELGESKAKAALDAVAALTERLDAIDRTWDGYTLDPRDITDRVERTRLLARGQITAALTGEDDE